MTGRVVSLHRWPVKSLGGEEVQALEVDGRGAAGDRAHALYDEFKGEPRRLTARQVPRVLLWHAAYGAEEVPPDDPPAPRLTSPAGETFTWGQPELPRALAEDLGRPVTLRRDPALMQDLPDSLLVTFGASHRAGEAELGPLDPRRWRTNIHVEADAPAYAEAGWEGRALRVGDVVLDLLHPCERCVIPTRDPETAEKRPELLRHLAAERDLLFGINARPREHGWLRAGDAVALLD
jgi:hypothetical protein